MSNEQESVSHTSALATTLITHLDLLCHFRSSMHECEVLQDFCPMLNLHRCFIIHCHTHTMIPNEQILRSRRRLSSCPDTPARRYKRQDLGASPNAAHLQEPSPCFGPTLFAFVGLGGPGGGVGAPGGGLSDNRSSGQPLMLLRLKNLPQEHQNQHQTTQTNKNKTKHKV